MKYFVSATLVGRCRACGDVTGVDTIAHGRLGEDLCKGRPQGRLKPSVWLADALTLRHGKETVPHPYRGHTPTPEEMEALRPILEEVNTTRRSITARLVTLEA